MIARTPFPFTRYIRILLSSAYILLCSSSNVIPRDPHWYSCTSTNQTILGLMHVLIYMVRGCSDRSDPKRIARDKFPEPDADSTWRPLFTRHASPLSTEHPETVGWGGEGVTFAFSLLILALRPHNISDSISWLGVPVSFKGRRGTWL